MQSVLVDRHRHRSTRSCIVATSSTPLSTRQKAKKNMLHVFILLAPIEFRKRLRPLPLPIESRRLATRGLRAPSVISARQRLRPRQTRPGAATTPPPSTPRRPSRRSPGSPARSRPRAARRWASARGPWSPSGCRNVTTMALIRTNSTIQH